MFSPGLPKKEFLRVANAAGVRDIPPEAQSLRFRNFTGKGTIIETDVRGISNVIYNDTVLAPFGVLFADNLQGDIPISVFERLVLEKKDATAESPVYSNPATDTGKKLSPTRRTLTYEVSRQLMLQYGGLPDFIERLIQGALAEEINKIIIQAIAESVTTPKTTFGDIGRPYSLLNQMFEDISRAHKIKGRNLGLVLTTDGFFQGDFAFYRANVANNFQGALFHENYTDYKFVYSYNRIPTITADYDFLKADPENDASTYVYHDMLLCDFSQVAVGHWDFPNYIHDPVTKDGSGIDIFHINFYLDVKILRSGAFSRARGLKVYLPTP